MPITNIKARSGDSSSVDSDKIDDLEGAELAQEVLDQRVKARAVQEVLEMTDEEQRELEDTSELARVVASGKDGATRKADSNVPAQNGGMPAMGVPVAPEESRPGAYAVAPRTTAPNTESATLVAASNRGADGDEIQNQMESGDLQASSLRTDTARTIGSEDATASIGDVTDITGQASLAEATPVEDERLLNLPRAVQENNRRKRAGDQESPFSGVCGQNWKTITVLLLMSLALIAAVAVSLGTALNSGNSSKSENAPKENSVSATSNASSSDVAALEEDLISFVQLPEYLLPDSTWSVIHNETKWILPLSPQAKAYQWLTQDPNWHKYTEDQLRQRFTLATFFYATAIQNSAVVTDNASTEGTSTTLEVSYFWRDNTNWLDYSKHECSWFFSDQTMSILSRGIQTTADMPDGMGLGGPCQRQPLDLFDYVPYVRLWMSNNGLVGTVPDEISLLTSLESIDLSLQQSNIPLISSWFTRGHEDSIASFGGPLNAQTISTPLEEQLHGTLPSSIGQLTSLRELKLSGNHFSGSLPSELGLLAPSMDLEFRLTGNFFTGEIPTELFRLTSLRSLVLSLNSFSGSFPSEVGQLNSTIIAMFQGNNLVGTLPTEIGLLQSATWFLVGYNRFTGVIPTEISGMSNLLILNVEDNQLTGTFPSEIGALKTFSTLNAGKNMFSGKVPSELGLLHAQLSFVQLEENRLTGTLPTEFGLLSNAYEIVLHDNQISGTIASELGQMNNLLGLYLSNNSLSGPIPTEIGLLGKDVESLFAFDVQGLPKVLDISNNSLGGTIPTEMGMLSSMEEIWMQSNPLEGSLPTAFGNLISLKALGVHETNLTGSMPNEVCKVTANLNLERLEADCEEVTCACCTTCH